MPRVGMNPMKKKTEVHTPAQVTVATIVYIPVLAGYWEQSLDVLKLCLESILKNTPQPFDLLVFDNGSCAEVRQYLSKMHNDGNIQYLVLSQENVGKVGAWNFIFAAAPGEYIAYTDSDVKFHAGWLERSLKVFETFEKVGMVTACPSRSHNAFVKGFNSFTRSYAEIQNNIDVIKGDLIPKKILVDFAKSLGITEEQFIDGWPHEDILIKRQGVRVFEGAVHYQFVMQKNVALQLLPLYASKPVGVEHVLDVAINEAQYLRLSLEKQYASHLGNRIDSNIKADKVSSFISQLGSSAIKVNNIVKIRIIRKILTKLHNLTFNLLNAR